MFSNDKEKSPYVYNGDLQAKAVKGPRVIQNHT